MTSRRRDRAEQPMPDLGIAVAEDDRDDAVVRDDAAHLCEGCGDHRVVVLAGAMLARCSRPCSLTMISRSSPAAPAGQR